MSQKKQIIHYLESGGRINGLSAIDMFGCYRLSSVINILRNEGVAIKTKMIPNPLTGKEYGEYYMDFENKDQLKMEF